MCINSQKKNVKKYAKNFFFKKSWTLFPLVSPPNQQPSRCAKQQNRPQSNPSHPFPLFTADQSNKVSWSLSLSLAQCLRITSKLFIKSLVNTNNRGQPTSPLALHSSKVVFQVTVLIQFLVNLLILLSSWSLHGPITNLNEKKEKDDVTTLGL